MGDAQRRFMGGHMDAMNVYVMLLILFIKYSFQILLFAKVSASCP